MFGLIIAYYGMLYTNAELEIFVATCIARHLQKYLTAKSFASLKQQKGDEALRRLQKKPQQLAKFLLWCLKICMFLKMTSVSEIFQIKKTEQLIENVKINLTSLKCLHWIRIYHSNFKQITISSRHVNIRVHPHVFYSYFN